MRPNLASLVDDLQRHGQEIAVVAHRGNRRYRTNYVELRGLAGRVSAELARRQVAPGERVLLWGENSAEWIAAFFGCLLRGVIAVPLDAAGSSEFAAHVLRDVSPRLIFADPQLAAKLTAELTSATPVVLLPELGRVLPQEPLFTVDPGITPDTPFQIVFTSGTTSEPRGIVHTHRNVLASLEPIEREMQKYLRYERWVHPLRFLHTLPLSHVFGQFMGLWIPSLLGAQLHFTDAFEAARMVELLRRERVSVLIAVPRVLGLVRSHLLGRFPELGAQIEAAQEMKILARWWRFRRVHRVLGWKFWAVISGGATLPAELEAFWNRLGLAVIQGYGMTETSALVTLNHPFQIRRGTIGKPLPGRDVRITPEGELLVRGPMLSSATWERGGMRPREDEWLATGDLAERTQTGELKFLGRKGDVIVTSAGLNIHPADVEAALVAQIAISAAAVVPCQIAGSSEPVAVVLSTVAEEELHAAVTAANAKLAEFQQVRRVLRWPQPAFPFTSTGKLLRREVAAWACATLAGRPSEAGSRDVLLAAIAEVTGEPAPLVAADPGNAAQLRLSEDFHLDSLGRVQLQTVLEQRLAIELDDDALAVAKTLGDLRALVGQEGGAAVQSAEPAFATRDSQSGMDAVASRTGHVVSSEPARSDQNSYPRWPWMTPVRLLRSAFIELVMRPLVWLLAKPRVEREGNESLAGPYLLIANHVTAYDGALILYALSGRLRRRVAIAMSGEMLLDLRHGRNQGNWIVNLMAPIGYWLITVLFNVFPLPRARGFRRAFAHAGEALDSGYSVLIFPEGTRTRDAQMHPFRPGIGLLASESAVPVVPIAMAGLAELRVRGRGWFRSGQLTIRIGKPIPIAAGAEPSVLSGELESAVRGLLERPSSSTETGDAQS